MPLLHIMPDTLLLWGAIFKLLGQSYYRMDAYRARLSLVSVPGSEDAGVR